MKFIFLTIYFCLILHISCITRALYYEKEKCFIDYFYNGMNLVMTYKITDTDIKLSSSTKTIFRISLASENGNFFKLFYGSKLSGKFSYSIEESDKYKVCIITSDKELFKFKPFLHLIFKVQSSDELFDESSAKAKDFQKVNMTKQNLNSKVDSIETMQNFQVEVEDEFSKKQISTSSRLVILSLCQIAIICLVGIFHVYSLRKVFKDKIWTPF